MSGQIVKAELEVKDTSGETYTKEYDLPVGPDSDASEELRERNKEIKKEIEENHWFHRFEGAMQTENIVWYKLTRIRDIESDPSSDSTEGDNGGK